MGRVCGDIRWVNVGHGGGTPVQRAASATWMLLVKMATVWVGFSLFSPTMQQNMVGVVFQEDGVCW